MIKPPLLLFDWFEIDVMGDCFLIVGWVDDYTGSQTSNPQRTSIIRLDAVNSPAVSR
jgi:hypothetical protein